jgi:hypothetical protein
MSLNVPDSRPGNNSLYFLWLSNEAISTPKEWHWAGPRP